MAATTEGLDIYPWTLEELHEILSLLRGGELRLYSDALMEDSCKAVAVWAGTKEKWGKIFTKVVEGLPHDLGRGKFSGKIFALRTLVWAQIEKGRV